MKKLSESEINNLLKDLNNWSYSNNVISKKYQLKSFMESMSFSNLIADKSEQMDHHPKIEIDFKCVEISISTHSVGGITDLDIDLANFIEELYNELYFFEE